MQLEELQRNKKIEWCTVYTKHGKLAVIILCCVLTLGRNMFGLIMKETCSTVKSNLAPEPSLHSRWQGGIETPDKAAAKNNNNAR